MKWFQDSSLKLCLFLAFLGLTCSTTALADSSSPTNFQFTSSPPIPYPSFSEGVTDSKLTGSYLHSTEDSVTMNGGGLDYKIRFAASDWFAFGADIPLNLTHGSLGGDFGSGTMNLYSGAPVLNTQFQLWDAGWISAIAFGGVNFNYGAGSINQQSQGVSINVDMSMRTVSFPLGAQIGVSILPNIMLAPFFTYSYNAGGIASFTSSVQGTSSSMNFNIPSYHSQSYGLDVVLPKNYLSIGALIQNTLAAETNEQNMKTFVLQLGWLFRPKGIASEVF